MSERVDRYFTEVGEVAGFEEQPSQAQQFEAFGHGLRYPRGLNHHVSATALGEASHKIQPVGESRLGNVQHMVRPKSLSKLQAVIGKIDGNDVSGSEHAGLHQKAHAQRTDAEHHDRVVKEK